MSTLTGATTALTTGSIPAVICKPTFTGDRRLDCCGSVRMSAVDYYLYVGEWASWNVVHVIWIPCWLLLITGMGAGATRIGGPEMAYKRAKIRSSACIPRYWRIFISCEKGQVRLQLFVERTGYLTWELEAQSTSDRKQVCAHWSQTS